MTRDYTKAAFFYLKINERYSIRVTEGAFCGYSFKIVIDQSAEGNVPDKMSEDEVLAYIDSKPGWALLSTIGCDGYPHTVPVGYFRVDHKIYMGCRDNTQKVVNIERNPRVSISLESGTTMPELKGVLLRGSARVIRDRKERLTISNLAAQSRGSKTEESSKTLSDDGVYIELSDFKMTSWDYGK